MVVPSIAFGVLLLLISGALFSWSLLQAQNPPDERDSATDKYLDQQSRRRFHVNGLVSLCGIAFIILPFLTPVGGSVVGLLAIIMVIRILYLAMTDMVSTQRFLLDSQLEQLDEVKTLKDEIEQFRAEKGGSERNGSKKES